MVFKFSVLLFIFMVGALGMVPTVFAADEPTLAVTSPQEDTVVGTRADIQFKVENFTLTARPEQNPNSGVMSVYINGKFYENFATSSARLTFPRSGTHLVEAELLTPSRNPVVPPVRTSFYLHSQKKSAFLGIKGLRNDSKIYTNQPTFEVEYQPESFEESGSRYYRVFIDGVVDGDSRDMSDFASYTLQRRLLPGRHTLRIALFNDDDRAVTPAVDTQLSFSYIESRPDIDTVELPAEAVRGEVIKYVVTPENFSLGKDGYVVTRVENGTENYSATVSGELRFDTVGAEKVTFELRNMQGLPLLPEVKIEKIVSVTEAKSANSDSLVPSGLFTTGEDLNRPRWLFLALAALEAFVIIVFGILLFRREKN